MEWRYWADAILAVCLIPILIIAIPVVWILFLPLRFFLQ